MISLRLTCWGKNGTSSCRQQARALRVMEVISSLAETLQNKVREHAWDSHSRLWWSESKSRPMLTRTPSHLAISIHRGVIHLSSLLRAHPTLSSTTRGVKDLRLLSFMSNISTSYASLFFVASSVVTYMAFTSLDVLAASITGIVCLLLQMPLFIGAETHGSGWCFLCFSRGFEILIAIRSAVAKSMITHRSHQLALRRPANGASNSAIA